MEYVYATSIRIYSSYRVLRTCSVVLYNGGIRALVSELQLIDILFLPLDFLLFGEYVPTFNDTSILQDYSYIVFNSLNTLQNDQIRVRFWLFRFPQL